MAEEMPKTKLRYLPIDAIRENPSALRQVNKQSEEFRGLVESIRTSGILNPIVVREVMDKQSDQSYYGLVDGLHRYTAAQDAGLKEIPANVISASDGEVLEAQILANIHKVETRPVECTKQLIRILAVNPLMTQAELAKRLSVGPAWLAERLGLIKLDEKIASLVDDNKIGLSNAYGLAKLPVEEQASFIERAMTMTPQEFVPTVNARVKEIREAKHQGRDPNANQFVAVPHMRKLGEINEEVQTGKVADALVREFKPANAKDAFKLALEWVRHMDPMSQDAARKAHDERVARDNAEKEDRKRKREEEKAAKAQDIASQLQKA